MKVWNAWLVPELWKIACSHKGFQWKRKERLQTADFTVSFGRTWIPAINTAWSCSKVGIWIFPDFFNNKAVLHQHWSNSHEMNSTATTSSCGSLFSQKNADKQAQVWLFPCHYHILRPSYTLNNCLKLCSSIVNSHLLFPECTKLKHLLSAFVCR